MNQEILQKLYEPFDVQTKPGSGNYKYIKSSDVIDRMNKAFDGKWSTEVVKDEILEDIVLVRVLVSVQDEETRMVHRHEGYGSSAVKRYNSGPNKDKIIDLGSVYKAAEAMAIRNACSRWGVGLNLEGDSFDLVAEASKNRPETAAMPTPAPAPAPVPDIDTPAPTPPPTPPNLPPAPSPAAPVAEAPPVEKTPPFPAAPTTKAPVKEQPVVEKEAPKSDGPFPKIPMPSAAPAPASAPPSTDENEMISDVQKAALNGLLTIRGLEYDKLATDAFTDKGMDVASIPQPDDLTYKQAVVVIKYGNDLFKKKN